MSKRITDAQKEHIRRVFTSGFIGYMTAEEVLSAIIKTGLLYEYRPTAVQIQRYLQTKAARKLGFVSKQRPARFLLDTGQAEEGAWEELTEAQQAEDNFEGEKEPMQLVLDFELPTLEKVS